MLINFTKMHSLGNDFIVIDLVNQYVKVNAALIKRLANRHLGIGCDSVLLIEPPNDPSTDFHYKIYNADGHEAEQCGNGARCLARYLFDNHLANDVKLRLSCKAGIVETFLAKNKEVGLNIGKVDLPSIKETNINLNSDESLTVYPVSTGNPHAIMIVEDLKKTPVEKWGKTLSKDKTFENGANIGFMRIVDKKHIELRVYERGAGLTLACGSNAIAAVAVGQALDKLEDEVKVSFQYGPLTVKKEADNSFTQTGPTIRSFMGRFRV